VTDAASPNLPAFCPKTKEREREKKAPSAREQDWQPPRRLTLALISASLSLIVIGDVIATRCMWRGAIKRKNHGKARMDCATLMSIILTACIIRYPVRISYPNRSPYPTRRFTNGVCLRVSTYDTRDNHASHTSAVKSSSSLTGTPSVCRMDRGSLSASSR